MTPAKSSHDPLQISVDVSLHEALNLAARALPHTTGEVSISQAKNQSRGTRKGKKQKDEIFVRDFYLLRVPWP